MKLKEIREMYPEGTQIVLTEMAGESQMPYGLKGTVKFVDDAGQIHMSWENGSSLALNINEDTFEKVEAPEKISVILVEPGRYPKLIEIEDTLEAMQSLVEGDIEEYMPFEDEVAIICNDEGKMNGLPLNRAVYSEPENVEMSYPQLKAHFRQAEKERNHTTGYIVFTDDSFDKPYTEEQRTYVVSSNNKAFIEGMAKEEMYHIALDDYEHGIIIRSLNDEKTDLMNEGKSTDAVDDLIIKVGTAPKKKFKVIEKERSCESR